MARIARNCLLLLICGLLAIWIAFYYGRARSDIIISDRMSEFIDTVDRHLSRSSHRLILFDLDDTVFMSTELIGTPTWFYTVINLLRQKGAAKFEAYEIVRKIDKMVQERVSVVAVEQATISAIRNWQNSGAVVVGMTSRPDDFYPVTKAQLQQIGLHFWAPVFPCIEKGFENHEGSFRDGVIYITNLESKSDIVARFLELGEACGMDTRLIAAADDQQRYVTEIGKLASNSRTDFIGIIYGGALADRNFDLGEAKRQLLNLEATLDNHFIPDEYRTIFARE